MKKYPVVMLVIMLFDSGITFGQETNDVSISDPARNRLFFMPTGWIMPRGTVSVDFVEVVFPQMNYAPTDFMQLSLLWLAPLTAATSKNNQSNLILGAKFQFISDYGLIRAFSMSVDFANVGWKTRSSFCDECTEYYDSGFDDSFDIYGRTTPNIFSLNSTVSVGNEAIEAHMSVAQLRHSGTFSPIPTYFQAGIDFVVLTINNDTALKLLIESYFSNTRKNFEFGMAGIGVRHFNRKSSVDFGWAFGIDRYNNGSVNKIVFAPYPLFSAKFLF